MNIYCAALGALAAIAIVGRVRWRAFAVCALLALMTLDALSILVTKPAPLMAMRFLHGCVGGMLVGAAYSVFARTRTPDRVFGMLLVIQYGLGGLGIMLLPRLVPVYGPGVLFGALFAFSFVTLLMLPFLDSYPRGRIARPAASGSIRFGRTWPFAIGTVLTIARTLAFHWGGSQAVYLAANCVTAITWSFVIAYLPGLCAEFDQSGRTAALGGFLSKMGLATGPFAAAWLLDSGDYAMLINISAIALAASLPMMFVPARALDRAKGDVPL